MTNASSDLIDKIKSLQWWDGLRSVEPLTGGLTNQNFKVKDNKGSYVVRLGDDIPVHQLMRFNELAASKAACAAGISPAVVYQEPGILVLDFIASKTLKPEDVRDLQYLPAIADLVKSCHRQVQKHLRGPALIFWVFHILRDYAHSLRKGNSEYCAMLDEFQIKADVLERASGPHDIVFGHNDLLAANFLDDGHKLWLIDWDYAGFNDPLFDLGGLASNNEFEEEQETLLLELYYEKPIKAELLNRYHAMKCASLLRETMWSMVSQIHSEIEFDFRAYSAENLARFDKAYREFSNA